MTDLQVLKEMFEKRGIERVEEEDAHELFVRHDDSADDDFSPCTEWTRFFFDANGNLTGMGGSSDR
jgi:hypothetical protein